MAAALAAGSIATPADVAAIDWAARGVNSASFSEVNIDVSLVMT
jgi:hypothetical protein